MLCMLVSTKLDIVEKKDNPFLKRTDLMLKVDHKGQATPKREELEKDIAKQFKSVPEKVEIVYIFSEAGLTKSKIKARVWKEKTVEKRIRKPKEKKLKEEPKKEEKVEEKEEVKPEEVKEEPTEKKPEEQKPEEKPKPEEKKEAPKEEPKKEETKPTEEPKPEEKGEKE